MGAYGQTNLLCYVYASAMAVPATAGGQSQLVLTLWVSIHLADRQFSMASAKKMRPGCTHARKAQRSSARLSCGWGAPAGWGLCLSVPPHEAAAAIGNNQLPVGRLAGMLLARRPSPPHTAIVRGIVCVWVGGGGLPGSMPIAAAAAAAAAEGQRRQQLAAPAMAWPKRRLQ